MKKYLLLILVLTAFFLRVYKGPELFFWNVDQDLISLTVKRIVEEGRPQLIGFPIPGGIYLGPIFYYLVSAVYLLSGMDPSRIYIISAILGTVSTYLVWRVGKEIFGSERVGIFAAIIFGFSYLSNVYWRSLSGLTFAPILALLVYLLLYRSLKSKKVVHLGLFTIILLIAAQNEGSSLSLMLLTLLVLTIYQVKLKSKQVLKVLAAFAIFHFPLVIFDLRHDFFLTKSILNFAARIGGVNHFNTNVFLGVFSVFPNFMSRILMISGNNDVSAQMLPCVDLASARLTTISHLLFISSIVVLGWFLITGIFSRRKIWGEKIVLVHLLLMVGGLFVYNLFLPGYVHEWILVIFLPAFCFIFALFLTRIYKIGSIGKIFVVFFIVTFLFLNIKSVLNASNINGLANRVNVTKTALESVKGRPFYLASLGSCFAQGYIYLFDYYGNRPIYVEGLIYDSAFFTQGTKPDLGIVLASPSKSETADYFLKYNDYRARATSSHKVGNIELLIIEDD